MSEWYIQHAGKTHGPIDDAALKKLASSNQVNPETPLRKGADGQWTKCGKLKGLFNSIAKSPNTQKTQTVNAVIKNAQFYVTESPKELAQSPPQVAVIKVSSASNKLSQPPALVERATKIATLLEPVPQPIVQQKSCPFCAELIALAAKKCRHCNEFLDPTLRAANNTFPQAHQQHVFNNVMQAPAPVIINNNNNIVGHAQTAGWNPAVAAILSLIIPGLGQVYKGQPINGVVWFVVVIAGYMMLLVPGVILHVFCVCGAAMGNPYR